MDAHATTAVASKLSDMPPRFCCDRGKKRATPTTDSGDQNDRNLGQERPCKESGLGAHGSEEGQCVSLLQRENQEEETGHERYDQRVEKEDHLERLLDLGNSGRLVGCCGSSESFDVANFGLDGCRQASGIYFRGRLRRYGIRDVFGRLWVVRPGHGG